MSSLWLAWTIKYPWAHCQVFLKEMHLQDVSLFTLSKQCCYKWHHSISMLWRHSLLYVLMGYTWHVYSSNLQQLQVRCKNNLGEGYWSCCTIKSRSAKDLVWLRTKIIHKTIHDYEGLMFKPAKMFKKTTDYPDVEAMDPMFMDDDYHSICIN